MSQKITKKFDLIFLIQYYFPFLIIILTNIIFIVLIQYIQLYIYDNEEYNFDKNI